MIFKEQCSVWICVCSYVTNHLVLSDAFVQGLFLELAESAIRKLAFHSSLSINLL